MGDGLAQVARGQVDPVRGAHVVREVARQLSFEPLEVPLELRPHVRVDQPRGQAPPGSAAQPGQPEGGVRLPPSQDRVGHQLAHRRSVLEAVRSEEHTSELQSHVKIVCRLLLEKKKKKKKKKRKKKKKKKEKKRKKKKKEKGK